MIHSELSHSLHDEVTVNRGLEFFDFACRLSDSKKSDCGHVKLVKRNGK